MRLRWFAVISLYLLSVGAVAATTPAQKQLQPILGKMMRLANRHDTDGFMAFHLHKPELVFVFDGNVIHGWKKLHAQQLKWWKHGKSDVVYKQTAPTDFTQLAPDLVVTTQSLSGRRTLPNGKPVSANFIATEVWKKLPQGWRIVYAHESLAH